MDNLSNTYQQVTYKYDNKTRQIYLRNPYLSAYRNMLIGTPVDKYGKDVYSGQVTFILQEAVEDMIITDVYMIDGELASHAINES